MSKFKVGETVKHNGGGFDIGEGTGKIVRINSSGDLYYLSIPNKDDLLNFFEYELEKIDLQEEEKPTFKVGDRVKILSNVLGGKHPIGAIGIITFINGRSIRVSYRKDWWAYAPENLQLISTPEQKETKCFCIFPYGCRCEHHRAREHSGKPCTAYCKCTCMGTKQKEEPIKVFHYQVEPNYFSMLREPINNSSPKRGTQSLMEKLKSIPAKVKRFLNANYRSFYKLGWIDEDLEPTANGIQALNQFLFEKFEKELGDLAGKEVQRRKKALKKQEDEE